MSYEFTAPAKDPSAVLDHGMDWASWLDAGETITAQSVVSSPAGLTISIVGREGSVVSWRLSGGSVGQNYVATVRITTSKGRVDERSVLYKVRER